MRQMTPCSACRRHHDASATHCPHCRAKVGETPLGNTLRRVKMGGLLAFTAATAAACYGVAPPPGLRPVAMEAPKEATPTRLNTAWVFVTQEGGKQHKETLQLDKAEFAGARLSVKNNAGRSGGFTVELPKAADYRVMTEAQALSVKDLKFVYADVSAESMSEANGYLPKHLTVTSPGSQSVTGTFQVTRLDAQAIGGVLKLNVAGTKLAIYFLVDRRNIPSEVGATAPVEPGATAPGS